MTTRERFNAVMRFGRPDRVPLLVETFGDDVLDRWREQGLAAGADPREEAGAEKWEQVPVSLDPRPWPKGPVVNRERLRELKERLDPEDPERLPADWSERAASWRARDVLVQLPIHRGFFLSLGVHDWGSFEEAVAVTKEDPALVRETMEAYRDFYIRLADRVLRDVRVDFATFSEPIGTVHGPLVSPGMYEDYCLSTYRPLIAHLKGRDVPTVALVTFANARVLLRGAVKAGFNCLWAYEVGDDSMDYRSLRAEFGRKLGFIGGIDLDAVLAGGEVLRHEMTSKVPALLAEGGYIPLADGRIRANVPLRNYVEYRTALAEMAAAGRPGGSGRL